MSGSVADLKQSRYLRKEDFPTPVLVTISGVAVENVGTEDEPQENHVLRFEEYDKPMVLKSTNGHLIEQALGSGEFDHWTGKKIVVFCDPNVTMKGRLVGGIRCRAVKSGSDADKANRSPRPRPESMATGAAAVGEHHPATAEDDNLPF